MRVLHWDLDDNTTQAKGMEAGESDMLVGLAEALDKSPAFPWRLKSRWFG
jgi:hypothetical protein